MPDATPAPDRVAAADAFVTGIAGGRSLLGWFRLSLSGGNLVVAPMGADKHPGLVTLPLDRLSGVSITPTGFRVFLESGATVTASALGGQASLPGEQPPHSQAGPVGGGVAAGSVAALAAALEDAAYSVGEVMRSSRVAGSSRAAPGDDHDRFFAPFLEARLRLQAASDSQQKLQSVSAGELRAGVLQAIAEFARERFDNEPADRRALVAELEEYATPLLEALDDMDAAGARAREAPVEQRWAAWRSWRNSLVHVFAMAERAWLRMMPVLAEFPRPQPDDSGKPRRRRARK